MYRITRTDFEQTHQWQGFCAVVELGEKLVFPNGESYRYKIGKGRLRILEGPHKGWYDLTEIS
mgnify:CR=1 FL=1|tara:strand:- start:1127 stop:1315 length:189 start_codon:yes stop_codon:yes gene_type:complete